MLLFTVVSTPLIAQEPLPCQTRYENGRCETRYREDSNYKRHGEYIQYGEDGSIMFKGNYVHGVEHGSWYIGEFLNRLNSYPYWWYVNGEVIAKSEKPINSLAEAKAIAKKQEEERQQRIKDKEAIAEAEEKAKEAERLQNKIEEERLAIEEERLAKEAAEEAERVRKLRVRFFSPNVNLDDIIKASQGNATYISFQKIEEFKKFFDPESKAEIFTLHLGGSYGTDYEIFRKAVFNYISEKTTINYHLLPENLHDPDKVIVQKWNGEVRKVSLNDQIHAIKYKDGVTYFRTQNSDNNSWEYVASGNLTTKITSYGASSEAELINSTIALIGSIDNRSRCVNGKLLNNIIYRTELLQPDNKAEITQFILDVLLANGTSTICENGATDNRGVLYRTYAAYLLWSLGDKEQSKRLFTKINSEKPSVDRRDKAGEWVTGSYADYLNKYFHEVFVDSSSNDNELYELTLSRDKELKKFLKSL